MIINLIVILPHRLNYKIQMYLRFTNGNINKLQM
jgi:hypothetical protein